MLHFLHRHILLPAFETGFKRRKMFRYWKELEKTQWFARSNLEQLQLGALARLLDYAFKNCPYYRASWKQHDLHPNQLRRLADLRRWPWIDRETVREHRFAMRSQAPGMRLIAKCTGGSTGIPLHFDFDEASLDRRYAAWHRGYDWAGAGPGTKQFYFWGAPIGDVPTWKQWKESLYHWLYRRRVLNSFEFTEEHVPEYLAQFNQHRPDVLVAYTNPLYEFARAIRDRGLKPYTPSAVVVGAEKLHPFQRRLIEEVFGAPVFETYGSREFTLLGAECERHEGLHLTVENYHIEILDDNGDPTPPGQEGNVVITDLYNFGMPFIRYANGDRAVASAEPCSCGRGLPLLKEVVGRQLDILKTPDGRFVPGEFFPHLLKEFPAVKRFQVVQNELDQIQLRVVVKGGWDEQGQQALVQEVRKILGPAMRFELRQVEDIALTPTGKFRVVVNRCAVPTEARNGPMEPPSADGWDSFPPA